jgi:hypothetical protein
MSSFEPDHDIKKACLALECWKSTDSGLPKPVSTARLPNRNATDGLLAPNATNAADLVPALTKRMKGYMAVDRESL